MNCKPNVWTLVIQHSPDTMQFAVSCHKDLTEFGWILQRCTLKIQCINFLGNGLKTILNFCDGSKSIFIHFFLKDIYLPLVLWQCWLSVRKSIRPVKNWMMRCIWSSWCHCHPIIFCFIKIQIGLTFLVPGYPGCPEKEAIKWVCLFFWETVILLFHHPDARKIIYSKMLNTQRTYLFWPYVWCELTYMTHFSVTGLRGNRNGRNFSENPPVWVDLW